MCGGSWMWSMPDVGVGCGVGCGRVGCGVGCWWWMLVVDVVGGCCWWMELVVDVGGGGCWWCVICFTLEYNVLI